MSDRSEKPTARPVPFEPGDLAYNIAFPHGEHYRVEAVEGDLLKFVGHEERCHAWSYRHVLLLYLEKAGEYQTQLLSMIDRNEELEQQLAAANARAEKAEQRLERVRALAGEWLQESRFIESVYLEALAKELEAALSATAADGNS